MAPPSTVAAIDSLKSVYPRSAESANKGARTESSGPGKASDLAPLVVPVAAGRRGRTFWTGVCKRDSGREPIMARKRTPPLHGKARTREHVIADLAVNHVERQVLLGGGTVERIVHDYGLDLVLFTYTSTGEIESSNVFIQVKATEKMTWLQDGEAASFRLDRADLVGWLHQLLPVILVVYDATEDRAYWLHVQGYFAALPDFNLFGIGPKVSVHLSAEQILEPATVRQFAALRDEALQGTKGG
jgi:hypothetical protein